MYIEEFWQPKERDIREVHRAFTRFLDNPLNSRLREAILKSKDFPFHAQYIGYVKKGERYIYGNFYSESFQKMAQSVTKFDELQPVVMCDGGTQFWGAVYRFSSRSITSIDFNGEAPGRAR